LLMAWGTAEMDRLGLFGYLEASAAGKPLYEKFGFKVARQVVFDATKYGASEKDVHAAMLRQPKHASTS